MKKFWILAMLMSVGFYAWSYSRVQELENSGKMPLADQTRDPERFTRRLEPDDLIDWDQVTAKPGETSPSVARSGPPALTRDDHLARFEDPARHAPDIRPGADGPGGSDWDSTYRAFLKTSAKAVSQGFSSHDKARAAIVEEVRAHPEQLDQHLTWVVFIKKFSQKYRPPEGTESLRKLYIELLDIKFSG